MMMMMVVLLYLLCLFRLVGSEPCPTGTRTIGVSYQYDYVDHNLYYHRNAEINPSDVKNLCVSAMTAKFEEAT